MLELTPLQSASLLVLARQNVAMRNLGDVPGHEFHGNQWSTGSGPSKEEAWTFLQGQLDKFGGLVKGDAQLFAQSPNELYRDRLVESFKPHLDELHTSLEKQYGKTITVYRAEHSKDSSVGVRSFSLSKQGATDFLGQTYRRGTTDVVRVARISVKDVLAIGEPKHGEVLIDSKHLRSASRHPESQIHAAADAHLTQMTVAVMYAFLKGRKAYKSGGTAAATKAVRAALLESLPPVLVKAFKAGGNAAVEKLPKVKLAEMRAAKDKPVDAKLTMKFDAKNEAASKWAKQHAGELAKDISATTEQAIKDAVARAQEEGDLRQQRDDILDAVGDESRAELIARTESMTAANEGQREAWDQAVDAGLLTGDERREWIATSDACDDCSELDGETTDLDGEYPNDGGDGPPLHPNCRCTEGIVS